MSEKFKDFGSGVDTSNYEPISFQLHGEIFECVRAIQGKLLLDLVTKSRSDDPSVAAETITGFFSHVLTDDSLVKFNELVTDKDRIVTVETLGEITGWLIEQLTERPEQQPEV
jgi:hypothetical protein